MSDEIDKTIERVSDPNYKPKTLFEAGMQENVRLVAAWAAEQIMGTTQLNLEGVCSEASIKDTGRP